MNVLILNASPKRKGGASRFFSKLLKGMLAGHTITTCDIHSPRDYEKALSLLHSAHTVVISSPLYVDGIPAHVLPFLVQAQQLCTEQQLHFKLYALSNNGFIDAKQNALHLRMYEAWCARAGVQWGGGLGIGGGVLLHVLFLLFPFSILMRLAQTLLALAQTGHIPAMQPGSFVGLLITPALCIWPLLCLFAMAQTIKKGECRENRYTQPPIPSFLFIIVAGLFMLLSALAKGTLPHKLFHRVPHESTIKKGDDF
ncbi:NAD(P)H-dependent oxidoreductase [Ruminococcaceae bacterium OttesenSCG-928-N02]|nr:NAD(P)H-dependent oxidoreductase [Ruminococcaceae bacterium OttesenSCG-928-N02]